MTMFPKTNFHCETTRCACSSRLVPGPNLGPAASNRDLRLYPEVCFSYIVTNLDLSVI